MGAIFADGLAAIDHHPFTLTPGPGLTTVSPGRRTGTNHTGTAMDLMIAPNDICSCTSDGATSHWRVGIRTDEVLFRDTAQSVGVGSRHRDHGSSRYIGIAATAECGGLAR
jgi:hypothetical protein